MCTGLSATSLLFDSVQSHIRKKLAVYSQKSLSFEIYSPLTYLTNRIPIVVMTSFIDPTGDIDFGQLHTDDSAITGFQYLVQGHLNMWPTRSGNWTTDPDDCSSNWSRATATP